ncbi:hypothetical protein H6X68_11620, partial [Actinomyces sp. 186855]|nr:hypothetical protein [Actinomyces sp. 187325]MCL3793215.1 hypothetical protein [Actinomyces sp. 186855]MCL3795602.1 hypothetical protein [Actinomyces sp. 217892]
VAPRRPRVPGPGRTLSLLALAVVMFSLAATGWAATTGRLGPMSALIACAGLLATVLGAGVVISALRGRRGGWMSFWGLLTLMSAAPSLVVGSVVSGAGALDGTIASHEERIVVTEAVLEGTGGRLDLGSYAAGNVSIDLRSLSAEAARGVTIDVSVGVGSVRVWTQQGQAVTLNAEVGVGETTGTLAETWHSTGVQQSQTGYFPWAPTYSVTGENRPGTSLFQSGLDIEAQISSPAAQAGSTAEALQVNAEVGIGSVRVDERRNEVTWSGWMYDSYWVVDSWQEPDGSVHGGDELPVPGMTFPAVSSDDVWECSEQAVDLLAQDETWEEDDVWTRGPDSLDTLPDNARSQVDACVLTRIGVRTGQLPDSAETEASPTTEPTAAPTATPEPATASAGPTAATTAP